MEVTGAAAPTGTQPEKRASQSVDGSQWKDAYNTALSGASETTPGDKACKAVSNAPLEVQYLDGATNKTKTGYVINGAAYEDRAGTTPVSDYSRFRTEDFVLYVKSPYGIIRSADFAKLLEYQSIYDAQTFGQAILNADGDIVGSASWSGGELTVSAPLDCYTSAPGGPGTVSREMFEKHYSSIAGAIPILTIEEAAGSGTPFEGSAAIKASCTAAACQEMGDESAAAGGTDNADIYSLVNNKVFAQYVAKLALSAVSGQNADSVTDEIAFINEAVKTNNTQPRSLLFLMNSFDA